MNRVSKGTVVASTVAGLVLSGNLVDKAQDKMTDAKCGGINDCKGKGWKEVTSAAECTREGRQGRRKGEELGTAGPVGAPNGPPRRRRGVAFALPRPRYRRSPWAAGPPWYPSPRAPREAGRHSPLHPPTEDAWPSRLVTGSPTERSRS
jgi:hypothetical protein